MPKKQIIQSIFIRAWLNKIDALSTVLMIRKLGFTKEEVDQANRDIFKMTEHGGELADGRLNDEQFRARLRSKLDDIENV